MAHTKQLITDFVNASESLETTFQAYALDATARKLTVNEAVAEILSDSDANLPDNCIWKEGEKGAGKKVGTVKSLSTCIKGNPYYKGHAYLAAAKRYEGCASHYLQSNKKVLLRKSVEVNGEKVWQLRLKKAESRKPVTPTVEEPAGAGDGGNDKAVMISKASKDFQAFIDAIRPHMNPDIREAALQFASTLDLVVEIPAV